jgi:PucR C-terminal helix-turn-helix domain/GGDEF-like domain
VEIEATVLTRVNSVVDTADVADAEYAGGLRAAVSAALAYAIAALAEPEGRPAPLPVELLAQARRAARAGVPLDAVLRRYVAGHALLSDFIVTEAEAAALSADSLQDALRFEAATLDHLIDAVSAEYRAELEARSRSAERRRADRARRLLAGELADPAPLDYDLDAHHLGAIGAGPGADRTLRDLARALDRRLLLVRSDERACWAWLGGRRPLDPAEAVAQATSAAPPQGVLALGEPAQGLDGWRLTHRQAAAALPVAQRGPDPVVRYSDVALLATALQDDLLVASLRRLYLEPLARGPDRGETARQTLRAYFKADRNVSSAAPILRISRNTVASRLRVIEEAIGRPLAPCAAEFELALDLESLAAR